MRTSCLLVFTFFATLATAQDADRAHSTERTISVYGTGYVEGDADRATVTLTLEGEGSSLQEAIADAQEKVGQITGSLQQLGLPETAFATLRFTGYDGGRPFLFAKREYKSSIALTITVDDLDLLEAVVLTLSESPVERIAGIQFSLRDLDALRRAAREQALADAEAKAAAMTAQLSLRLGPVLHIEEEPTIRQNSHMGYYAAGLHMAESIVVEYERPRVPEVQIFAQRFAVQAGTQVTYAVSGE